MLQDNKYLDKRRYLIFFNQATFLISHHNMPIMPIMPYVFGVDDTYWFYVWKLFDLMCFCTNSSSIFHCVEPKLYNHPHDDHNWLKQQSFLNPDSTVHMYQYFAYRIQLCNYWFYLWSFNWICLCTNSSCVVHCVELKLYNHPHDDHNHHFRLLSGIKMAIRKPITNSLELSLPALFE